ncbi:MAG: LysE family translocator [Porticoccaceae bacterium]|nr:LysE family translocator [Porticoccaceae bacterium]
MDISWINEVSLGFWIAVTLACALGAMSPGPSLAVVVNHTLAHGRAAGCYAAISHGVGVGIYALITVFGLAVVIEKNQEIFDIAQLLGCLFLLLMAAKILFSSPNSIDTELPVASKSSSLKAIADGFLIALINPKILLFFTALFSQFVRLESDLWEKLTLALIASGVDAIWYLLVALTLSHFQSVVRYQRISGVIDKIFAVVLIIIASNFIFQITQG